MRSNPLLATLTALVLTHCGVSVAPLWDATADGAVDAATTKTVTFVVTMRRTMRPTPLATVLVRAETAEGDAIESVTDSNGRVSLSLATQRRWDITFAHRDTGVRSIMGLRPEATRGEIALWMPPFFERLPQDPWRMARPEDSPIRRVTLNFQPRTDLTEAFAGPAAVFRTLSFSRPSVVLEYGAIEGERGIDVVLIENRREEEDWRSPLVPIGVIHRRIEPVPEGDIELTFDAVSVQPTPEPNFVNVWRYAHETVRVVTQARDLQP